MKLRTMRLRTWIRLWAALHAKRTALPKESE